MKACTFTFTSRSGVRNWRGVKTKIFSSPSLRRSGGGNHSGERLGKAYHVRRASLSTPRVPRLHPPVIPLPASSSIYCVSTGSHSIHRDHPPTSYTLIDPRPSHSKVRDPASTSYLTPGKFHLLKLLFTPRFIRGKVHEDWMPHSVPPEFHPCYSRMDGRLKSFIHRLSYSSIQVPFRQSSTSHLGTCERGDDDDSSFSTWFQDMTRQSLWMKLHKRMKNAQETTCQWI